MGRAQEISEKLADNAEAVCRTYLSNGVKAGGYWLAGNVGNAKGDSLWVRIRGPRDRVGRWRDEACDGHYGDLLDLIRFAAGCSTMSAAMSEAERFLRLPKPPAVSRYVAEPDPDEVKRRKARALFNRARAIAGSPAEEYFRARGLSLPAPSSLKFHPDVMYRGEDGARRRGPAILAAISDHRGEMIGVHRTWFAIRDRRGVALRRKIIGQAWGGAVALGGEGAAAVVGEGWETVYSLAGMLGDAQLFAALSTGKLTVWRRPPDVRSLFIAVDRDENAAGEKAATRLIERLDGENIHGLPLFPRHGDFNDDLRADGYSKLAARVRAQAECILKIVGVDG